MSARGDRGEGSARDRILASVRRGAAHAVPHPGLHPPPALDASWPAFAAALVAVDAEAHGPFAADALADAVLTHAGRWAEGGRIVAEPSAAARLGRRATALEVARADAHPHDFADVAVAVVRGELGVAESGAVAVLARDAPHRSLLFLAERVVLLLDPLRLAGDLGSALRALPADAAAGPHLTWICGPSRTADIEQTLVVGAHGPRALAVFAGTVLS